MALLLTLLLAASIPATAAATDGTVALRHASALAALGPHPWGSTRNEAAALYVAAQMRGAGLTEVELQRFERHGIQGTNVVGTLRGPGEELVLVGAHHDTAPGAAGAYDDGGGVGVSARARARAGRRAFAHPNDRVRVVRRRGGLGDREGHDRRLARVSWSGSARARASSRARSWWRCAAGRAARPCCTRSPTPTRARPAPRSSPPAGSCARRSRPRVPPECRWEWAIPTCPGCTSRRCARSACGSTATTCRSCRRAGPLSSPPIPRSRPSTPITTSPRTSPTGSMPGRSRAWAMRRSRPCARSTAHRAGPRRSRTGSPPLAASSTGRGCSASVR